MSKQLVANYGQSVLSLLTAVTVLVGCSNDPRISDLKKEQQLIMKELDSIKVNVDEIQFNQLISATAEDLKQSAFLTPDSQGYVPIGFDLGILTVSIKDIASYANGCKVTLEFGNVLSAAIDGIKTEIEYGAVNEKGIPQVKTAKTKTITFTESLLPGAWTKVSVILDIPSEQLGYMRFQNLTNSQIKLNNR